MYRWIRDLHLYLGLFVSPFVLLFAASVFYLNHGTLDREAGVPVAYANLAVPAGLDRLTGRAAVEGLRGILPQLDLAGEIGFVRHDRERRRLSFPVTTARLEATVELDPSARSAIVRRRSTGFWESAAYLHKMPGPHNAAIRGNWIGTRIWRWLADTTIYLLLFLSLSGVYLWWAIRAERAVGAALLMAGGATLSVLVYAVIR